MKTKVKPKQKTREYIISKVADERIQSLLLSPIELAAYKAEYKPFQFTIEGINFDITPELCRDLMQLHFTRLRHFHEFVDKLIKTKLYSDPKHAKFLLAPLKDHKLSARVYHCLYANDCATMSDVLKLGKRGILHIRGIGNSAIEEIKALLVKNDCGSLLE